MKKLLSLSLVAVLTMGAVGLSGCASDDPTLFAIPAEIEPRPALDSVPDDTAFVAQMSGPGGFAVCVSTHVVWAAKSTVTARTRCVRVIRGL